MDGSKARFRWQKRQRRTELGGEGERAVQKETWISDSHHFLLKKHTAMTFDFPSFHGRGTRDEGDQGYGRRGALPPSMPSLSCLFSFLLSPDFH